MPFRISRDKSSAFCDFQTLSFCFHANRVDNLPVSVRLVSLKQSGDCKNFRLYQLPNRNKFYTKKKTRHQKKTLWIAIDLAGFYVSQISPQPKKNCAHHSTPRRLPRPRPSPCMRWGAPKLFGASLGSFSQDFHTFTVCVCIYIYNTICIHTCMLQYIYICDDYMWLLFVILSLSF
jgi:hypothetical protein